MGTPIHWLAIVVAAAAGFAVGGVWYGPIFGKAWAAARGLTPDALKDGFNMPLVFGLVFVLNLFSALVLDHVLGTYGDPNLKLTLLIAGGIAVGFILPAMAVNYLFSRLSLKLFLIDGGYWLTIYLVMGAILDVLA